MKDRSGEQWEKLAQREPYFAVLTEERFLGTSLNAQTLRDFFATGVEDVSRLFEAISQFTTHDFSPRTVLDFGCGAGRLTAALAQRADRVVGVDVAPTMRKLAKQHCANLDHVRFLASLDELRDEHFDLVCSLIVFQHIPVKQGEELFEALLRRLAPNGVAAVQFTFSRPGGALRRLARRVRSALPFLHRVAQLLEGRKLRLPYMEMNTYDLDRIRAMIRAAGCGEPTLIPTDHGGIRGAIVIAQRG